MYFYRKVSDEGKRIAGDVGELSLGFVQKRSKKRDCCVVVYDGKFF